MIGEVAQAYVRAKKRLFLLDYDGTLADIKPTPPEAAPTPEILSILKNLAADERNKVVVISGRAHANLDDWLGGLPLDISAEHGLFVKEQMRPWRRMHDADSGWKDEVKTLLHEAAGKAPGSFLEDKTYSLGWHYRNAAPGAVADVVPQLLQRLQSIATRHKLSILNGNKVIEVKPAGFSKGTVASHWLNAHKWDFIMAAGDDTTDEDLFAAMPPGALTIKIGEGDSAAQLRLESPARFRSILKSLAKK